MGSTAKLAAVVLVALAIGACGGSANGPYDSTDGPYNPNATPEADIAAALSTARSEHKLVLLDFGANWCPDCIVLDKLFQDPQVNPYLKQHFVLVNIDVGNFDHHLDISQKYGDPISGGIPAEVVLNADGKMLASTKNGALADARNATAGQILKYLEDWEALSQ